MRHIADTSGRIAPATCTGADAAPDGLATPVGTMARLAAVAGGVVAWEVDKVLLLLFSGTLARILS